MIRFRAGEPARRPFLLLPLLVVLAGYALRVFRLDASSISGDEVNSLMFASRLLVDTFSAMATKEPHPPFYYTLLGVWVPIAGQSELALRLPSVLLGTLAVAAAYPAGRSLGGRRAGIAAAAILAASQFSVLHAQDARMYAALQAWTMLLLAGLGRSIQKPDRSSQVVVVAAGALAAYTHYHGLLLVALGGLLIGAMTPVRLWPRRLAPWGVIGLLYLPWVVFARDIFLRYRGWMDVVPPAEILRRSAVSYSLGLDVGGATAGPALLVLPALALIGIGALVVRRQRRTAALLLGLAVLPLAAVVAASLVGRPLYHERYLLVVTPAYFVLAGLGLGVLSRRTAGLAAGWAALGALAFVALGSYYSPAMPDKPDFRAAVSRIEREAVAPAVAVMSAPQGPIVDYYLKDGPPVYVNAVGAADEMVGRDLADHLTSSREAWFVRYSAGDWDDPLGRWLEANAYYLRDVWVTRIHLVTYAFAPPGSLTEQLVSARTRGGIEVERAWQGPGRAQPGGRVFAGFGWRASGAAPAGAKVSLRLLDPWGQSVAMLDRPLANPAELSRGGLAPVWQGALTLPDDAVPGRYRWEVRFYDRGSGESWSVADATEREQAALSFGEILVEPAPALALRPDGPRSPSAVAVDAGLDVEDVWLSGGPFSPDSRLRVSFTWRASAARTTSLVPEIGGRSVAGGIVASVRREEADQPYLLSRLRAGERVRELIDLPLRAFRDAGSYDVVLRAGPDAPWVRLGSIEVQVDSGRYRRPGLAQRRDDLFDRAIRLVGAAAPDRVAPGAPLMTTLAWQAERLPSARYTVFVHLAEASGRPLAQSDQVPAGGRRPTDGWILGEYVVDEHRLTVPADLPAGEYRLVVGLYDSASGRRATVAGDNQSIDLGSIRVDRAYAASAVPFSPGASTQPR